jgi:hypothetical protein
MKWIFTLGVVLELLSVGKAFAVVGGVTPTYVNMKIYEMRVSTSADCSNGRVVFKNDNAGYENMMANPTLGSGQIPNGTYECIMIHYSDQLRFAPSANQGSHGVCIQDQESLMDGSAPDAVDGWDEPDGTHHDNTAGEDRPWVYFFSGSTGSGDGAGLKGTGLPLTSPLVINGSASKTFAWDFTDAVGEQNVLGSWECHLLAASISFR